MLDLAPHDMSASLLTRRRWLQSAGLNLAGGALLNSVWPSGLLAAEEFEPLNRYPRMVHEFFVQQVRKSDRRNREMLDRLKTKADAEKYVRSVREKIRRCFGPEPPRTPLNPRVTGVVERDEYRIEKVIFESRPNFPVTANLYIPRRRELPLPGVVGSCGHSANGKAAQAYQAFAHKTLVTCVAFSNDGRLLLANEGDVQSGSGSSNPDLLDG